MNTRLQPLMQAMGYTFRDPELLEHALTHSSYANEGKARHSSNERLEFLGDSVLGFITADYLFAHDKGAEGELTKRRASLVCEKALSGYAQTGRFSAAGQRGADDRRCRAPLHPVGRV